MGDNLVAVLVVGLAMLVPIIAIMTRHQLRMTELFRGNMAQPGDLRLAQDNEALRRELAEVKQLLQDQAIAIDNLAKNQAAANQLPGRLEDRV